MCPPSERNVFATITDTEKMIKDLRVLLDKIDEMASSQRFSILCTLKYEVTRRLDEIIP